MSDSRKAKLVLFLAILLLPSILQVGVLVSSAASTNSTYTFNNSIYGINTDLAYFFSYLSAILLVMAIYAIRKDFTYGMVILIAGVLVGVMTAHLSLPTGSLYGVSGGTMNVQVYAYQYYPGYSVPGYTQLTGKLYGGHWETAPGDVFDDYTPVYIVAYVLPIDPNFQQSQQNFEQINVTATVYYPNGLVMTIPLKYNMTGYLTYDGDRKYIGSAFVSAYPFIPSDDGRYDIVVTATYRDPLTNTTYYGSGQVGFSAVPPDLGSFFVSSIQALSNFFISSLGSNIPLIGPSAISSINGLIYTPYINTAYYYNSSLPGSQQMLNSSYNYITGAIDTSNLFNFLYTDFAEVFVPVFLAATVGINAFMGNYGDFYDLLRDLIYKLGVYYLFTTAGFLIWDYSAFVMNALVSQILTPSDVNMVAGDIASMLTLAGLLFAGSTAAGMFGNAMSQLFMAMLMLTVTVFMAGMVRTVILFAFAALIPVLAALWVFEWTRRFVSLVSEIGLAFFFSGLVDAVILKILVDVAGSMFYIAGPIFIGSWVAMGIGVGQAASKAGNMASQFAGAGTSAMTEAGQKAREHAGKAKERISEGFEKWKEGREAQRAHERFGLGNRYSRDQLREAWKRSGTHWSDFEKRRQAAEANLRHAEQIAASHGLDRGTLDALRSMTPEEREQFLENLSNPDQRKAAAVYVSALNEMDALRAESEMRQVRQALAYLNAVGVKVDPDRDSSIVDLIKWEIRQGRRPREAASDAASALGMQNLIPQIQQIQPTIFNG